MPNNFYSNFANFQNWSL